jgi:3'-phosphoadenosine 5'-phosphosulfate sulfotransferase (PAPS reductase)/FAD synthetase/ubiquinone/menaquinone biosynthesis C-methylase UbiE
MNTLMNLAAVDAATPVLLATGERVFNANLFGETEQHHVEVLLDLMEPARDAVVLDAGCGVGEVARLMREKRPDLTFKLLNVSSAQLAECPAGMEQLLADFSAIPLPDESVDVAMFNYSLCHAADWSAVFREAARVLRAGGTMFINDLCRLAGSNQLMQSLLGAQSHFPEQIEDCARRAGFALELAIAPPVAVQRLKSHVEPALYDLMFKGVVPTVWNFRKVKVADPIASAFARHARVAFQFSGGRDSTAALYLLRPYWDRMTVYHLDTGDQFPETRAVVAQVERDVPIVRIRGDVAKVREQHGLASDLVPVDNTDIGRMVSGREVKLQSRYDCCARALMLPMHERMRQDGITLIVRGQRDDEYAAPPKRSGESGDGFEVLYPIQTWTGEQVSTFLKGNGLPLAQFYERGARRAPECMGCTAWWDEGRAGYMREHHPKAFEVYRSNMKTIRIEIDRQYQMLDDYSQRN